MQLRQNIPYYNNLHIMCSLHLQKHVLTVAQCAKMTIMMRALLMTHRPFLIVRKITIYIPVLWKGHLSSVGPEEGGRGAALFFPSEEAAARKPRWIDCSLPPKDGQEYQHNLQRHISIK